MHPLLPCAPSTVVLTFVALVPPDAWSAYTSDLFPLVHPMLKQLFVLASRHTSFRPFLMRLGVPTVCHWLSGLVKFEVICTPLAVRSPSSMPLCLFVVLLACKKIVFQWVWAIGIEVVRVVGWRHFSFEGVIRFNRLREPD